MNGTSTLITSSVDRSPSGASGEAYFACRDLRAYYGESYVVQRVSFELKRGEILALLGRNGAGKTSTLRAIARLAQPHLMTGEIWLDGQPVHELSAWQVARRGVSLVPEDRRIIGGLSVEENLRLAQIEGPVGWSIERIYKHFPKLAERRKQEAVTMSGGEQQMLAIARALALDVKLLLLDEPYEGLAPIIVREIEKIVHEIKELGLTIVIVEQNAVAALHLASRALILEMGQVVFNGAAHDLLASEELRHKYLAI
jgi:branched-chain amino acid transport system ATP-binding protein